MPTIRFSSATLRTVLVTLAGGLAGCTTPTPVIDTSASAPATFDGLYVVRNARADQAWARPGIDLSQYSKIMLESAGIEYRPGGETAANWPARRGGGPFEVSEDQKETLRRIVREVFLEELGESDRFDLVDAPGPDVLLIRAALLDVVSNVPPDSVGRVDVYLSEVGAATLVIELRDGVTEAILARAVDRRAAESVGYVQESNPVTNRAEIRRLARSWARSLREQLDALASLPTG